MKLLVIRHAIAEERETFAATGQDDGLRPLTRRGERRMAEGANGLLQVVGSITTLASSPLVRARQTAAIVARAFGDVPIETLEALGPDNEPEELLPWLRQRPSTSVAAIVGHEPHLGLLVSWLMSGGAESRIELRKGSACLLEFSGKATAGAATLVWALTPSQLRRIGG